MLPVCLDVKFHGAPAVHVLYWEVGIRTRVLIVSEGDVGGLVEQMPIGGSSPGTRESRRPEAAWVRFL